jgi:threonine/homoserine/homoserine lactone efflux protein
MTFAAWLSLFSVCLLGAMSPGPSLAMVTKHCLGGGRLNGLATAWAHAFGIGVYAFLTLIGLSVTLHQAPLLFTSISYGGAAYLAYLGWKSLRSKGSSTQSLLAGVKVSLWQSAREGLLISLLNPKIALFFIALFSQFVSLGHELSSKIVVVATPLVVDGLWYTFVTLLLSSPLVIDKLRAKSSLIDKISGMVLIGLAVRVLVVS